MKKFLSMMLLAVGIIFGTQLAAVKTAHAELVYAFSYDGADYYIDTERSDFGTELFSTLPRCFRGSTEVYGYIQLIVLDYYPTYSSDWRDRNIYYKWRAMFAFIDGQSLVVYDISTNTSFWGDFSRSVYNIYQHNLAKIKARIEQHNREVEARKRREEEQKRREAEAREREKQRLAEQQRREEEARKNKFDSLIAAGDQAYIGGDYSAAVQSYESARELDKSTVDKFVGELVKNGDNLSSQENYPAALDYYKKAFVMNPNYYYIEQKLLNTYYSLKNLSEAVNFFRTMTTIKPDDDNYWFLLGNLLDSLKDYDGAIAAYTRSAELKSAASTYQWRGNAYKNSGRYDEAIADYTRSLELFPEHEFVCKDRGDAYKILGRYDEAIADYKKALEFRPDYKDALDELWDAYCETGKFDDAADFYNKRVTANPKDSDSWFRLALSLNEQKKFRDAITAMCLFIGCLTDDSSSADGWYWLARIHQNAGDTKKAVNACKKALKLDPKHADAKKLLDQLSGGK